MGCMSSSMFCTKVEVEEIFRLAAVEMLLLCSESALQKSDQITIAPPMGSSVRKVLGDLKASSESHSGEGLVGMLLGKAKELGGAAAQQALATVAQGLDSSMAALSTPMSSLAKEVVSKNAEQLERLYREAITATKLTGNVALARRGGKDAITVKFSQAASERLQAQLKPLVTEVVKQSSTAKAWQLCVDRVGDVNSKLSSVESLKHIQLPTMSMDLTEHMTKAIVEQLAVLMGEEEGRLRAAPSGQSRRPLTFEMCFAGNEDLEALPREWYENRHK